MNNDLYSDAYMLVIVLSLALFCVHLMAYKKLVRSLNSKTLALWKCDESACGNIYLSHGAMPHLKRIEGLLAGNLTPQQLKLIALSRVFYCIGAILLMLSVVAFLFSLWG